MILFVFIVVFIIDIIIDIIVVAFLIDRAGTVGKRVKGPGHAVRAYGPCVTEHKTLGHVSCNSEGNRQRGPANLSPSVARR